MTVSPSSATVQVGSSLQLNVTIKDGLGNVLTDREVTWASDAPTVASVSGTGLVKGESACLATITATSDNGRHGSASITVPAPSGSAAAVGRGNASCR